MQLIYHRNEPIFPHLLVNTPATLSEPLLETMLGADSYMRAVHCIFSLILCRYISGFMVGLCSYGSTMCVNWSHHSILHGFTVISVVVEAHKSTVIILKSAAVMYLAATWRSDEMAHTQMYLHITTWGEPSLFIIYLLTKFIHCIFAVIRATNVVGSVNTSWFMICPSVTSRKLTHQWAVQLFGNCLSLSVRLPLVYSDSTVLYIW